MYFLFTSTTDVDNIVQTLESLGFIKSYFSADRKNAIGVFTCRDNVYGFLNERMVGDDPHTSWTYYRKGYESEKDFLDAVKDRFDKARYVVAHICWKNEPAWEDVTIKLSCDVDEKEDDRIFFYCNGFEDVKSLTKEDNGQDFVIESWFPIEDLA